jgi:hypothetical protein
MITRLMTNLATVFFIAPGLLLCVVLLFSLAL